MFFTHLKIAWRNLLRNKAYSLLNITGLAIGIAACLLIFTIVSHEVSYNTYQTNYKNVYRIVTENYYGDDIDETAGVPTPFLQAIKAGMPQIKTVANINTNYGSQFVVVGANSSSTEKKFIENIGVVFTDADYFKIFNSKWLEGNAAVLNEPDMVVIDKTTATKYFGDWKSAAGKSLKMDNLVTLKVAGVIADEPENTDLPFKIFISLLTAKKYPDQYNYRDNWNNTSSSNQLFVLLPNNSDLKTINAQLEIFREKYQPKSRKVKRLTYLEPLSELHFDTKFGNDGDHSTSKSVLWTLSLIGVLIIVMASINFINLSTAQAVGRAKEVGVKKVLGSSRAQLVQQLLGETFLIVNISVIIAFVLSFLSMPYLSLVASVPKTIALFSFKTFGFIVALIIVITLLSGIYPAFIMSNFKPATALKSKINSANVGGISMRRILVITQFAISQMLIIGTIVVVSQMNFVRNADLGFSKDAVYVISSSGDSANIQKAKFLKQQLLQNPAIQSVSIGSDVPASDNNWSTNIYFNHSDKDYGFNAFLKFGDVDYFKTYGLQLIAGKSISASDTIHEAIVNETLMHKLGFTDPSKIIGKDIRLGTNAWVPVIGVVKDFKSNSLREEVKPVFYSTNYNYHYYTIGIKLKTSNIRVTINSVQAAWEKAFPEYVYDGSFLDKKIADFYKQETQMELVYKIFACIAIFISCLGLYGLVSFMAVQKTKEVGVRKVLGASVGSILYLFSKEFTILILIAFVIAVPAAWYFMSEWLNNFVYKIHMSIAIFILAIVASLIIAWLTVGYKAFKAATVNPVKSLRSE